MEYEVRAITEDELGPFGEQVSRTFGHDYNPAWLEARKRLFEFDRNFATFDGSLIVGTAGVFSYEMTVPGGEALGCAGVTMVTVRSTHRRQGVLTGMMRKQLHDIHDRGEPLAALWASEASIYGRFGYGVAIQSMSLKLRREWSALRFGGQAPGICRLVSPEEVREKWPPFWERVRRATPGWVSRSETWWETRVLLDPSDWRDGFTANYYLQYEEDGLARGVARYRLKSNWDGNVPNHELRVDELAAETPEAYAALWRFLTGVDLVGTLEWGNASADEPLYWMLADSRRLARSSYDSIWVRIVDVEKALGGRGYARDGRVVLGVRDPFLPWCDGTFELEALSGGAVCRRTTGEADVTLSAADLAAVYLGGARLETLRRAGRAEGDTAAMARADMLLSWPQTPHCPEHF